MLSAWICFTLISHSQTWCGELNVKLETDFVRAIFVQLILGLDGRVHLSNIRTRELQVQVLEVPDSKLNLWIPNFYKAIPNDEVDNEIAKNQSWQRNLSSNFTFWFYFVIFANVSDGIWTKKYNFLSQNFLGVQWSIETRHFDRIADLTLSRKKGWRGKIEEITNSDNVPNEVPQMNIWEICFYRLNLSFITFNWNR